MDLRKNEIKDEAMGTCEWLVKHGTYKTWLVQRQGLLWIMGKPGAGKSTLVKYALTSALKKWEHVGKPEQLVIASFFFHGRGVNLQKTRLGLYRSLLHQILRQVPEILSEFSTIFNEEYETKLKPGEPWKWEENDLRSRLKDYIARVSKTHSVHLYVDALDEGGEEAARDLVDFFQQLTSLTLSSEACSEAGLKICFSCRYYPVISLPQDRNTIHVERENGPDVELYVQTKLKQLPLSEAQELEVVILKRADNVFQWLALVVPKVLVLYGKGKSMKDIQKYLLQFPTELGALYQEILRRIDQEDVSESLQLMQWICFAQRPLSLEELRYAMAIHTDLRDPPLEITSYVDTERMEKKVSSLSGGLAEVSKHGNPQVVQLIHQSVKDFLLKSGLEELETSSRTQGFQCGIPEFSSVTGRAHFRLSRACINYIAIMEEAPGAGHLTRDFPFALYAIELWTRHAKLVEAEGVSQKDLLSFLHGPSNRILNTWLTWNQRIAAEIFPLNTTLLHVAARYGLLSVVAAFTESEKDIDVAALDQQDSWEQTPLSVAAESGHTAIVELLLAAQVDPDSKDEDDRTPLSWAVESGHKAVVKLLLESRKVNANFKDNESLTPLIRAVKNGDETVVKMLLETKQVDPNLGDTGGRTPLLYATEGGHKTIVELLLKTGKVDPNVKALLFAIEYRRKEIVELLLKTGKVNPDAEALSSAIEYGDEEIVELLQQYGAKESP